MNPTPEQIKETRLAAGLSIIEMAKLMGVTRMTIYSWENGRHPMKERDYEYMILKLDIRND